MVRVKLGVHEKNDEKLGKCKKIAVDRVIEVQICGFNLISVIQRSKEFSVSKNSM